MTAVLQRVRQAQIRVNGQITSEMESGLLVFLGISREDTQKAADYLVRKITTLRIFPGSGGRFDQDLAGHGGGLMIVSQFTLLASTDSGRRPSYDRAAPAERARILYDYFVERARATSIPVATGVFQAHMEVHLINDGPVTLICESPAGGARD